MSFAREVQDGVPSDITGKRELQQRTLDDEDQRLSCGTRARTRGRKCERDSGREREREKDGMKTISFLLSPCTEEIRRSRLPCGDCIFKWPERQRRLTLLQVLINS